MAEPTDNQTVARAVGAGLKAVIFDFNGVIINDEALHQTLFEECLIQENVRPQIGEYNALCLGRSDRASFYNVLSTRGRTITESYLDQLVAKKSAAYQEAIAQMDKLPIYAGLSDIIFQFKAVSFPLAIVSGALRQEIDAVLSRANLEQDFSVIVAGDDIATSKPEPEGLLLAVERLNALNPDLNLEPANCLVIEDTPAGIMAAKRAGMLVVGVANTYPYHMIQRQANWTVDYLTELELDRIRRFFEQRSEATLSASAID